MFHSNASPFNQRQPKAGPSTFLSHSSSRPPMDHLPKKSSSATFKDDVVSSRPIITNSRVKRDEIYRRDMYLAFINNALLQKSKGAAGQYDELVSQFSSFEMRKYDSGAVTSQLRLWLSALSHVVSQIERTHSALVNAIINMPWTAMDGKFVTSYISFIGMLVSARPEYLGLVLEKIARGMTFRSGVHAIELFSSDGITSPLTRRTVYDRLHNLLEHLLSLIPTLPSTLQPLLVRNFPHKRQDRADQETYTRNLLRITEYCPALSDRILSTIIDRAIQIDVEIQVEMEELEAEGGQDGGEMFVLDPFDTVVGQEGSDSDGEDDEDTDGDLSDISSDAGDDLNDTDAPEVRQDLSHVQEMVAKLDGIMKLLFDYFHRVNSVLPATIQSPSALHEPSDTTFTSSEALPPTASVSVELGHEHRRTQFIALLSIFDRIIIKTFKSRYTQFLIFWYASLDPEFTDMFQGLLVSKALFEEAQPIVTRAAAASYIASFVSRAQFVDTANAKLVVGLLCDFLQAHLDACVALEEDFDPNSSHHTVFYAVAQAVLLIFCFRWRDLHLEDNEPDDLTVEPMQKKWISKLGVVQHAITSKLNPLKVCSANVVHQFARIARSTGFVYCYTIIENNKRSSPGIISPGKSRHSATRNTLEADLNTFFPFDPYKLPMSYSYVQGVYREWASVALQEDEDEEDEVEEEEETITELPTTSQPWRIESADGDDGTAALGTSFGGMSISPIRLSLVNT